MLLVVTNNSKVASLNISKLITFIDNKNDILLHFLEGQRLITQLAVSQNLVGNGFSFYRDLVLTTGLMNSLLKKDESLGFYIDSWEPSFSFKIEIIFNGGFRSILIPENFKEFPRRLKGNLRLIKNFTNKRPYSSITPIEDLSLTEIVQQTLIRSYQISSFIVVSEHSDQSILLLKLPPLSRSRRNSSSMSAAMSAATSAATTPSPREYWFSYQNIFKEIFSKAETDVASILPLSLPLKYLSSKDLLFECSCSHQRMLDNIKKISNIKIEELFANEDFLEITCEYCKKSYRVSKESL